MIQPTFIDLYFNEYSIKLHYYPFAAELHRCVGSCNTLNDLSNKVCVTNKTENLNLKCVYCDYRNKWIENINKAYIMQM